jgi:RNA 2',3'-cyclic 3'-phosphodiesterase
VRLFVAINLPPACRDAIAAATAHVREAFAREVRWSEAAGLHLTVKFLGEQPDEVVGALREAVRARLDGRERTVLTVAGAGAFPSPGRPRVLWFGVAANPVLLALYQDVEDAAADVGLPREAREFRAHLTLGRVRAPLPPESARLLTAALAESHVHRTFIVESIELMRSHPSSQGARYERLWSVPLADARHELAGAR